MEENLKKLKKIESQQSYNDYNDPFKDLNIPRESVYKWILEGNSYVLYYIYNGRGYNGRTYEIIYHGKEYKSVKEGEITEISFIILLKSYIEKITAPISGTLHFIANSKNPHPGQRIAIIDPSEDAVAEMEKWEKKQEEAKEAARLLREEQARQSRERAAQREREEIAQKIKERYRKKELEKLIRQELIDSGELFGDQPKRPPIPREVVDAVYKRDGGRCVYCGSTENLQLDHIIPFSKGGATSVENLQLLCRKCNIEKSNKIG